MKFTNILKSFLIIIIFTFSFNIVKAIDNVSNKYGTFEEAKKIVKEVMKSYYIREDNIQYHNSRRLVPGLSPENATTQDKQHTVCSGYTYDVYNEAFKMTNLPTITADLISAARNYYNDENFSDDGNFLIYYENTTNGTKYAYGNSAKFSDIAEIVQPGDLFVFTGHAQIVYDVVTRENGKKDVLLLNSNPHNKMASRTYGTSVLSYSYDNTRDKNNVIDIDVEGGIQYKWLSNYSSRFVETIIYGDDEITDTPGHLASRYNCMKKQLIYYTFNSTNNAYVAHGPTCDSTKEYIGPKNGYRVTCANDEFLNPSGVSLGKCSDFEEAVYDNELSCQTDECIILRPYYNCNGEACFNYDISISDYEKSKLRLNYPGIVIEKTSNKGDNNSVYPNDEITYTIKITNRSNVVTDQSIIKNYPSFTIEEFIDDNVRYISATNNAILDGNKLKWDISGLNIGESITLTYTVKVKANLYSKIVADGKIYNPNNPSIYISTGLVEDTIIPRIANSEKSYKACYNEALSLEKTNLDLIDYIYECARNVDLNFDEFSFTDLFKKKKAETDQLYFNPDMQETTLKFKNMILDNHWGGVTAVLQSGAYRIKPLRWGGQARNRKFNFTDSDFKDGDILIYSIDYDEGLLNPYDNSYLVTATSDRHTTEKGLYAYIYLDGKFVGINGSGETARNEFTYNYYNDIKTHLYSNYENLGDKTDEILKLINYETLLEKDYFIILRPELAIGNEIKNISKNEVPPKTYIVGKYMFTRNENENYNGTLTTKRIMLASKSISSNVESDMIIYYKKLDGAWINGLTGVEVIAPDNFEVSVVDLTTDFISDTDPLENYHEVSTDEIAESTYIIGDYMFSRNKNENYNGALTTKRIMLASRSILSSDELDMIIYYKKADGTWINALTGENINVPNSFKIKYVDLESYTG